MGEAVAGGSALEASPEFAECPCSQSSAVKCSYRGEGRLGRRHGTSVIE